MYLFDINKFDINIGLGKNIDFLILIDSHFYETISILKSQEAISLAQGSSNLDLESHFPAEFSCNPNQTHLNMLINVFRIIRKSQTGEFDQGWS